MNKKDKRKLIKLIRKGNITGFESNRKLKKVWSKKGIPYTQKLPIKSIILYLK